jgi:hypothetical protein
VLEQRQGGRPQRVTRSSALWTSSTGARPWASVCADSLRSSTQRARGNAVGLLAATSHARTGALLLVCADAAPGAAAVDETIARFSGRSCTPIDAPSGTVELEEIRAAAERLGPNEVLDRAQAELDALAQ